MSIFSVPHKERQVNWRYRKFARFTNTEPAEIPTLWQQSLVTESLAPESLRGGIARARTRLLAAVPSWRIPEVLDRLAAGGPSA
jgi:hypothetical protein